LEIWYAVIGLTLGLLILSFSSEKTVNQLIKLASTMGASTFTVGFLIASLGTDMPELVNSLISSYLGQGDISVGDSFGSVMTQISLILWLIPFFCRFCRLIPRKFSIVGLTEVVVLVISIFLSSNGDLSRLDGIILVILWIIPMFILRRVTIDEKVTVERRE